MDYAKVYSRIWNRPHFRGLSDDGKLIFFAALSSPYNTSLGIFAGSPASVGTHLGWNSERSGKAMLEAQCAGLLEHDHETGMIRFPAFLKYDPPASPNRVKSWVKLYPLFPESDFLWEHLQSVEKLIREKHKGMYPHFVGSLKAYYGQYGNEHLPEFLLQILERRGVDAISDGISDAIPHGMPDAIGDGMRDPHNTQHTTHKEEDPANLSDYPEDTFSEETGKPKPDPLEPYPKLATAYPKIWQAIKQAHPSAKIPRPGTKADIESRDALSKLCRLDGHDEGEVINCLRWLFKSGHKDAEFWKQQIASLRPLRNRTKIGLSKFASIHEKWEAAAGEGGSGAGIDPLYQKQIEEAQARQAARQAKGAA